MQARKSYIDLISTLREVKTNVERVDSNTELNHHTFAETVVSHLRGNILVRLPSTRASSGEKRHRKYSMARDLDGKTIIFCQRYEFMLCLELPR
jgi:hypothetical protein